MATENVTIKKLIKRVEGETRLEEETKVSILEKLSTITAIDDHLGTIRMEWRIDHPPSTVMAWFDPTPLILAIELNYIDIAKELIEKYPNSGYMKRDADAMMTPLAFAAKRDEDLTDMIISKLEKEEKIDIKNYLNDGKHIDYSILTYAIWGGNDSTVLKLYKKGARTLASFNLYNNADEMIIEAIIRQEMWNEDKKLALIKKLAENGEVFRNIDRRTYDDDEYETILDEVCERRLFKIAEFLIEHGYNPTRSNDRIDKVKEFKDLFKQKWKSTRLEAAVYYNEINNVKNALTSEINNILHSINNAYLLNHEEIMNYFEKHPELYYLVTEKGNQNIWTIATSTGNLRLLRRLQELGKKDKAKNTIFNFFNKNASRKNVSKSKKGGNKTCKKL